MTLHIQKPEFKCSKCKTAFIPYEKEIKCPKCGKGTKENISEYLNFIKMIAGSMEVHKRQYGWYHPGAWCIGSMSDHIQSLIFQTFDSMEYNLGKSKEKEKEYLSRFIGEIKWKDEQGDQEYLKDYVKEIAFKILDIYKRENFVSIEKRIPTKSEKVGKWFRGFLP